MPYIHKHCGGTIGLWTRKCNKCGKRWPLRVLFTPQPPKDMYYMVTPPKPKRGKTSYAGWGDKFAGVGFIASHLPNWPRWARVVAALVIVGAIVGVVLWLTGR